MAPKVYLDQELSETVDTILAQDDFVCTFISLRELGIALMTF